MDRWRRAAATGAHLVWRVKNGKKSLPAKVIRRLPDGSYLVRLRESDAMLAARRKAIGDPRAARLDDIVARLVEFDVIVTDEAGRKTPSHFRVLTTLTDHETHPARQVAQAYTERWQGSGGVHALLHGRPLRTVCATRRFIASPAEPGGIGGRFLDPMTHPDSKENGKRSMPENRWSCPGGWSDAPGGPHDTANS